MTPTTIIGLIVGLFALLAIVGTIIVYLRGTVADGTIASLERQAAALKGELETAQITHAREHAEDVAEINDLKAKVTALELKGKEQDRTIEILTNTVTNADEVKAIHTLLDEHHTQAMSQLSGMKSVLERVIIREGDRHGDASDV